MKRFILILWSLFNLVNVFSQESADWKNISYHQVNANTYDYFIDGKWDELRKYGKKAIKKGHNHYYPNLRTGIANYKLGYYHSAQRYLNKAIKKNMLDTIGIEYLFWAYTYNGNESKALDVLSRMSSTMQKKQGVNQVKYFETVGLSGGYGFSGDAAIGGSYWLAGISATHKLLKRVRISHNFIGLSQSSDAGKATNYQYHLRPTYIIPKGFTLSLTGSYSSTSSEYSYKTTKDTVYRRNFINPFGMPINVDSIVHEEINKKSSAQSQIFGGGLGLNYQANRLLLGMSLYVASVSLKEDVFESVKSGGKMKPIPVNNNPVPPEGNIPIKTFTRKSNIDSIYTQVQSGLKLMYKLPIFKDNITIGTRIYASSNSRARGLVIIPGLRVKLGSSLAITVETFRKGDFTFYDESSNFLMSPYLILKRRFNVGAELFAFKKTGIYLNWVNDKNADYDTNFEYTSNLINLSIIYKL